MATIPPAYPQTQTRLQPLTHSLALPMAIGPNIGMKWILSAGGIGAWLGLRETATADTILSFLREGDVFWDAGAGSGYHTLLASRAVGDTGQVHAFEAGAERDGLECHLQINQVRNVFLAQEDPAARHFTLDKWFDANLHRTPNVIRLGAPGSETRILRGAINVIHHCRPVVILHAHETAKLPPIASYSACRAILAGANYRVVAEFADSPLSPILMVGIPR